MKFALQSLVLCQPHEIMFYEHEEFESKDEIWKDCDLIKLLSMFIL